MIMFSIFFLLILGICSGLQPINPEQLGDTDWKLDGLAGTVEHALQVEEHSFVATSKSEIARLNNKGKFDWFMKVPDASVSNIAVYKRSLFSFSAQDNLVRMWNTVDGALLWEVFLGFKNPAASSGAESNILVVPASEMVTILNDNCLYFIGFRGDLQWKWCAADADGDLSD